MVSLKEVLQAKVAAEKAIKGTKAEAGEIHQEDQPAVENVEKVSDEDITQAAGTVNKTQICNVCQQPVEDDRVLTEQQISWGMVPFCKSCYSKMKALAQHALIWLADLKEIVG